MYNEFGKVTEKSVQTVMMPVTFDGKFHCVNWDAEREVFHTCGNPDRVINYIPSNGELTLREGQGIVIASPRAMARYISAYMVWEIEPLTRSVRAATCKKYAVAVTEAALEKVKGKIIFPIDLDPLQNGNYKVSDIKVDDEGNLIGINAYDGEEFELR